MKEKLLWTSAAVLSCISWIIHFSYYVTLDFSSNEKRILLAIDTWAHLITMGIFTFLLTIVLSLFTKKPSYKDRFLKSLPIAMITILVILIYALGTQAYVQKIN